VHWLPVHAPPSEHVVPLATQLFVPWSQQPVPLQVLPAQHGSPGPPHAVQTPPAPHALPAVVQVRPGQQG
jgi:hypothetical protein